MREGVEAAARGAAAGGLPALERGAEAAGRGEGALAGGGETRAGAGVAAGGVTRALDGGTSERLPPNISARRLRLEEGAGVATTPLRGGSLTGGGVTRTGAGAGVETRAGGGVGARVTEVFTVAREGGCAGASATRLRPKISARRLRLEGSVAGVGFVTTCVGGSVTAGDGLTAGWAGETWAGCDASGAGLDRPPNISARRLMLGAEPRWASRRRSIGEGESLSTIVPGGL